MFQESLVQNEKSGIYFKHLQSNKFYFPVIDFHIYDLTASCNWFFPDLNFDLIAYKDKMKKNQFLSDSKKKKNSIRPAHSHFKKFLQSSMEHRTCGVRLQDIYQMSVCLSTARAISSPFPSCAYKNVLWDAYPCNATAYVCIIAFTWALRSVSGNNILSVLETWHHSFHATLPRWGLE